LIDRVEDESLAIFDKHDFCKQFVTLTYFGVLEI